MLDVLKFILSDQWHFAGTAVLIWIIGDAISKWSPISVRSKEKDDD